MCCPAQRRRLATILRRGFLTRTKEYYKPILVRDRPAPLPQIPFTDLIDPSDYFKFLSEGTV